MDDVLTGDKPSPRVAPFLTDKKRQYFVVCEKVVLYEVPSIQDALFYTFASYYVFNLAYPKECEKVLSRLCSATS